MATKEQVTAMAQRAANETGKPHAVLNLNRYSPMYVCREWRPSFAEGDALVARIEPEEPTIEIRRAVSWSRP